MDDHTASNNAMAFHFMLSMVKLLVLAMRSFNKDGRRRIQNLLQLSQYDLCNVYNMDKTGLFFRLQPDKLFLLHL